MFFGRLDQIKNNQEEAFKILSNNDSIKQGAAILFSVSLDGRNYLRNQIGECGYNVVCFGNEAICFDNFMSLRPEIVVVETDSADVVWRFIFALYAADAQCQLVVLSSRLNSKRFRGNGLQVPVQVIFINQQDDYPLKKIAQVPDNKGEDGIGSILGKLPLLVGQTAEIGQIQSMLPSIADTRNSVLITGENGCGKELLARLIVGLSKDEECFVKIECSQLKPDMLVNGWLDQALKTEDPKAPVTIFVDRLDLLLKESQAEMLLVLEKAQKRESSAVPAPIPIRFIATAEKRIEDLVEKGAFRKDLFYRLNVIPITLPALRDRRDDISLLMDYFVIDACVKTGKCVVIPSQQTRDACYMYKWPGNVEELQRQMYRIAEESSESSFYANPTISKPNKGKFRLILNTVGMDEMPNPYEIKDYLPALTDLSLKGICDKFVARTEKRLMKRALESTNWNRRKAAELLNISYKSMLNKIKAYDIM